MLWKAKQLVKILPDYKIDKFIDTGNIISLTIGGDMMQKTKKVIEVRIQFIFISTKGSSNRGSIVGEGIYLLRFDDTKGHYTEIVKLLDTAYSNYCYEVAKLIDPLESRIKKYPILSKETKKNKANEILLFARKFHVADGE